MYIFFNLVRCKNSKYPPLKNLQSNYIFSRLSPTENEQIPLEKPEKGTLWVSVRTFLSCDKDQFSCDSFKMFYDDSFENMRRTLGSDFFCLHDRVSAFYLISLKKFSGYWTNTNYLFSKP